jgi:hypothetical protein
MKGVTGEGRRKEAMRKMASDEVKKVIRKNRVVAPTLGGRFGGRESPVASYKTPNSGCEMDGRHVTTIHRL